MGQLPNLLSELDEGDGIAVTLIRYQTCWHKNWKGQEIACIEKLTLMWHKAISQITFLQRKSIHGLAHQPNGCHRTSSKTVDINPYVVGIKLVQKTVRHQQGVNTRGVKKVKQEAKDCEPKSETWKK